MFCIAGRTQTVEGMLSNRLAQENDEVSKNFGGAGTHWLWRPSKDDDHQIGKANLVRLNNLEACIFDEPDSPVLVTSARSYERRLRGISSLQR